MRQRLSYLALLILTISVGAVSIASAGPNASGTLLVHATEVVYCADDGGMCAGYRDNAPLASCEGVDSNTAQSSVPGVWIVLAVFDTPANPRVSGVVFGVDYDANQTFISAIESCGDFELSTDDWPSPLSGTAVTWTAPELDHLIPVYAFAGYHYYATDLSFDLTPHPTQGSVFADDAVPANIDPIVALGSLGFNDNPGSAPCAVIEEFGACCLPDDCICVVVDEVVCYDRGGNYEGDGTVCDPNPCSCPAIGACCFGIECVIRTAAECKDAGGEYLGDDLSCDPNPCGPIPTKDSSWGKIKSTFR